MYKIHLFVEDYGHEIFLRALVQRFAKEASLGHLLKDLRQQFQAWQKSDFSASM